MGQFLTFILGLYMLVALFAWPVFWHQRTDRSQSPIERRTRALFHALAWPAWVVMYFTGRNADAPRGDR